MIDFNVLSITNDGRWKEVLSSLPVQMQDIFYTPSYYKLFQIKDGGTSQCIVFSREEKVAIYPFLKNSIKSLGYKLDGEYFDIQGAYGYNGMISNTNEEIFLKECRSVFNRWCIEENIIAEFTRFHPIMQNEVYFPT